MAGLMSDPLGALTRALLLAGPVLLAVTIHELAHGWVAFRLGDDTAQRAGRLSFNPLRHLDLVGTIVFFVTQMIGWAKPVPINPRRFRRPRQDMIWVSLAGPAANLALAVVFAQLYHLIGSLQFGPGSAGWLSFFKMLYLICYLGTVINIGLAVFNLLPIPPLDGSHILEGLLPLELAIAYRRLAPYGFLILIGLIFLGLAGKIIYPVITVIKALLL